MLLFSRAPVLLCDCVSQTVYITMRGSCWAPPLVCTAGSPGCITETVFSGTDSTCNNTAESFEILLTADGHCNPVVLPDGTIANYYQTTCADGRISGKGNCDSMCATCSATGVSFGLDGSCVPFAAGGEFQNEVLLMRA